MRRAVACAALSCVLGLASAKALKWSDNGPRWIPARETFGYMPFLGMEPPEPTPAPQAVKPRNDLQRRAPPNNTCGYIEGLSESPLWCAATARCVYNSIHSHIGCCDDGNDNCPIWTKCYDSAERASYSTNNGLTLWCGNASYPHCITHRYQDGSFQGYTLLGCAVAAGTGRVWYVPLTTSTSTSTRPTSRRTTSTSSTSLSTSSGSPDPVSTSTRRTDPTENPDPQQQSSTPVAPIVGGVVGGLAAIALIILGIWVLLRQKDKQKRKAAEAAAAAAAQQQQPQPPPGPQNPHMSQVPPMQGYYGATAAGFNPLDPRASIAKPPVAYSTTGSALYPDQTVSSVPSSPPHSPSPAYHPHGTPSPPPPQQQGQFGQQFGNLSPGTVNGGAGAGYQQQPQQQQHHGYGNGAYPQYTVELPAQRGDGELRELQG